MNQPVDQDKELAAIKAILDALDGLDGDAIQRVLDYVFGRLSIPRGGRPDIFGRVGDSVLVGEAKQTATADRVKSIRDLKEEKRPSSSNQMAAVVAYYLSEIVGEAERKRTITAADLEKYFKQAGFKLPKKLAMALPHATAAGYFDSAGSGQYRLNPVGYNLVAHALPRDPDATARKKP